MADINRLKERVQKAEEKVEKCKATIERHKKTKDKKIKTLTKNHNVDLSGMTKEEIEEFREQYRGKDEHWDLSWTIYEVTSKFDDIKGAEKKLREAEEILEGWIAKLTVEEDRERFLNDNAPQVIKDFLEQWREKAYDWHVKRYDKYQVFKAKLAKEEAELRTELGIRQGMFPNREQEKALKEKELDYRSIEARKREFAGALVQDMDRIRNEEERLAYLEKELQAEKKRKMLDLIYRINASIGSITDASYLEIDVRGNLNGIVIGDKGKAKVETIGAGGYNIQCFHFRTLVNKIKEKA